MSYGKQSGVGNSTRERIYAFLVAYKREHDGNTPTKREIAEGCCVSTSSVNYHLIRLEIANRIHVSGQGRSNIEVVGGAWDLAGSHDPATGSAPGERRADTASDADR